MNCKEAQEKIGETLAMGKSAAADVLAHKESCATCEVFYESQQKLFRSLDVGLQAIANAPVPPSLLRSVRSRIESAAPRHAWVYTWVPAGAVLLLCAVAFPLLHRADRRAVSPLALSSDQGGKASATASGNQDALHPNLSTVPRIRRVVRAGHAAPRTQSTSAHMEVVMGTEEARGLHQLVYSVHQKPALGAGFLRPVALPPNDMKPVPLIEIAELTMSPLADEQW